MQNLKYNIQCSFFFNQLQIPKKKKNMAWTICNYNYCTHSIELHQIFSFDGDFHLQVNGY